MIQATLPPKTQNTHAIVDHMAGALRNADATDKPFSNLFAQNIFPQNLYRKLLENIPDPAMYEPIYGKQLPDGTYPRTYYQLDGKGLANLPEHQRAVWEVVVDALLSDEFKISVFAQLRKDLQFRFQTRNIESIAASPRPRIVRDTAGYKIDPHPDTRKKAVTMMIYLPNDHSQRELGTSLYRVRPSLRGLTSNRGWFKEVKRFPFLPNSGFAFAVNNCLRKKSWHGREQLAENAGERLSLVTTFYLPGTVEYVR